MGNERTQRPEPFKRSTVALSLSLSFYLSLWQGTDFYFQIALVHRACFNYSRPTIQRVEASNRPNLPLLSLFSSSSSFLSPSGNGAFTDKRSLLAAGVALFWSNATRSSSDYRLFSLPILSLYLYLSFSLVTRNRSRLIVKKRRKKRNSGFGRYYPPTTTLFFCTSSLVREK